MTKSSRPAFALVAALISIVLLGALITGAFLAATEESREISGVGVSARALNAAESAVELALNAWAPIEADSLAIAQRAERRTIIDGVPVITTLIRLDSALFWLVGEAGGAGQSAGAAPVVRRRVGLLLRRATDSAGRPSIFRLQERSWSELF